MIDEDDTRERHPSDPRRHPNHKERGPKRWTYTYADVAAAAGVSVAAVKKAATQGKIDMADVASLARWIAERAK